MIGDVQSMITTALGTEPVTTTVEGRERYTVSIRYPRDLRSDPQTIATPAAAMPPPCYFRNLSMGNRSLTSAGTSKRVENGRRSGLVASMIILAVMMSST